MRLLFWRPKESMKGKSYVSSSDKKRSKVLLLYLECTVEQERHCWCMKGKYYVFRGYKQRSKVCFLYLQCKVQQERHCWCIFKWKSQKTVEVTYLETNKQKTRCRWCFWMLKWLRNGKNSVFRICQKTTKVQCMYFAYNNPKISNKKGQEPSRSWKESTNDHFRV